MYFYEQQIVSFLRNKTTDGAKCFYLNNPAQGRDAFHQSSDNKKIGPIVYLILVLIKIALSRQQPHPPW